VATLMLASSPQLQDLYKGNGHARGATSRHSTQKRYYRASLWKTRFFRRKRRNVWI